MSHSRAIDYQHSTQVNGTLSIMTADPSDTDDAAEHQLVAMILQTFAARLPDSASRPTATRREILEISKEWQTVGVWADWFELKATELEIERDRLHELAGCVAAAGEQLGLAWTSEQESVRWHRDQSDGRSMAVRAMADIRAHFSLGAAHGMGNATLRTLSLSPIATEAIVQANRRIRRYPPFSDDRDAWPSFNNQLVSALEAGARAVADARVSRHTAILRELLGDARYQAMEERRGMDFHRWRPQGLPPGSNVPRHSLWKVSGGAQSLEFGGRLPYDPLADPDAVASIATDGMDAVAEAMRAWIDSWPHALAALNAEILKAD
jgi:hypothetical protein